MIEPHRDARYSYCWYWSNKEGSDHVTYHRYAYTLEELKEHIYYATQKTNAKSHFALDFEDNDIIGETKIGEWYNYDTDIPESLATNYKCYVFRVGEQENKDVHYD